MLVTPSSWAGGASGRAMESRASEQCWATRTENTAGQQYLVASFVLGHPLIYVSFIFLLKSAFSRSRGIISKASFPRRQIRPKTKRRFLKTALVARS